ncbi:MAG: phosphate acyltransferase, partial [Bauldia litoralis]
ARSAPKRVVYADGEDERVLRAAQIAIEEGIARPILIGRPNVIDVRCRRYGLRFSLENDCEIINPEDDPRYRAYADLYFSKVGRKGIDPEAARTVVRTNTTVIAALAVERGDADALICGLSGRFIRHLRDIGHIIGLKPEARAFSALSLLINTRGSYFLTDTHVTVDPDADEIAEMTRLAAAEIRRFGIDPKAAMLSTSNYGTREIESAAKMRKAVEILWRTDPDLDVDGEMHGDAALSVAFRQRVMPDSRLEGEANLLVFPSLDAANIALNLLKEMTGALHVGPILLGAAKPAHIVTPSVTSRGVLNMTALAVVGAQSQEEEKAMAATGDVAR